MITRNHVLRHTYNDSIVLMQYTVELEAMPGIKKAAIMMATPAVLRFLEDNSLLVADKKEISSDDMIIAAVGQDDLEIQDAIEAISLKLQKNELHASPSGAARMGKTAGEADGFTWREVPEEAKVALISVPGQYAAAEAWQALRSDRHVMLFSNNVSIADEIALKRAGEERDLLVMGPDCGTAIINGIPLGFANQVGQGDIGIVAAAGSGLQALICLIDQMGAGISQAVGTGGRDLKNEVGGITTRMALKKLGDDPATNVVVVLSKPADAGVANETLKDARESGKPVVMCLLGMDWVEQSLPDTYFATTIDQAARMAVKLSREPGTKLQPEAADIGTAVLIKPVDKFIRGFYSGGTLAYEASLILQKQLGKIYSNTPLEPALKIGIQDMDAKNHIILDLGTEEFTTGRAHPMMDGRWRAELIERAGMNKDIAVILFDIILGIGADANPAGTISESIRSARKRNPSLKFIATVVGTERDAQGYTRQCELLKAEGVQIAPHNAMAVQMAVSQLVEKSS
jgi:FdrA protein